MFTGIFARARMTAPPAAVTAAAAQAEAVTGSIAEIGKAELRVRDSALPCLNAGGNV